MVNRDVHCKSQSVTLPDAPTLLDGQEGDNYTVELRPQIGMPVFSFNINEANEEKREIFANKDFRIAMSHAINRDEIDSAAYFDLGKAAAIHCVQPVPPFATEEQVNFYTEFDPATAGSMLDDIGLTDQDDDGMRDLPSGDKLILNLQFSTQGHPTAVAELMAQNWTDVGVETVIKEVTSDEYRAAQSTNELDVHTWAKGQPVAVVQGSAEEFTVPFGSFFSLRNGMLWWQYIDMNGAEGIEPPAWTAELQAKITEWQSYLPGTDESNALGKRGDRYRSEPVPIHRHRQRAEPDLPHQQAGEFPDAEDPVV